MAKNKLSCWCVVGGDNYFKITPNLTMIMKLLKGFFFFWKTENGSFIQDQLDHSASKEPIGKGFFRFLSCTVIQGILDQWPIFGFSRNTHPNASHENMLILFVTNFFELFVAILQTIKSITTWKHRFTKLKWNGGKLRLHDGIC